MTSPVQHTHWIHVAPISIAHHVRHAVETHAAKVALALEAKTHLTIHHGVVAHHVRRAVRLILIIRGGISGRRLDTLRCNLGDQATTSLRAIALRYSEFLLSIRKCTRRNIHATTTSTCEIDSVY
jgi:hypothetical protein